MLEVLPLTHIRGRSLTGCFVVVDEAQNLERTVLLTALSRLGQGSRVVLVGNCTAKLRGEGRAFCKGCPPVPSQIARTIDAGTTLDD